MWKNADKRTACDFGGSYLFSSDGKDQEDTQKESRFLESRDAQKRMREQSESLTERQNRGEQGGSKTEI